MRPQLPPAQLLVSNNRFLLRSSGAQSRPQRPSVFSQASLEKHRAKYGGFEKRVCNGNQSLQFKGHFRRLQDLKEPVMLRVAIKQRPGQIATNWSPML